MALRLLSLRTFRVVAAPLPTARRCLVRPRQLVAVRVATNDAMANDAPAAPADVDVKELQVYTMDGRRHSVRLPTVAFVTQGEVRHQVAARVNMDVHQLRLAYGGRELDPESDTELFVPRPNVDVIHALQRMTGGGEGGAGAAPGTTTTPAAAAAAHLGDNGPTGGQQLHAGEGGHWVAGQEADSSSSRSRKAVSSSRAKPVRILSSNPSVRVPMQPGARVGPVNRGHAEAQLAKQFRDLLQHPIPGVSAAPREDNLLLWDVMLAGPESTPYEGGWFPVELRFTPAFPGQQPRAVFRTLVWHPNIDDDSGNVCVDFATGFAATRSGQPVLVGERVSSLSAILVGLQMLLRTPNPLNSLNYHAGEQMNRDPAAFKVQAREWTARYAGSSQPDSAAQ